MNTDVYRCGWCGQPCDHNGEPLTEDRLEKWDGVPAGLVNGDCCEGEKNNVVIITRDMAIDAGDLSLEGQQINE